MLKFARSPALPRRRRDKRQPQVPAAVVFDAVGGAGRGRVGRRPRVRLRRQGRVPSSRHPRCQGARARVAAAREARRVRGLARRVMARGRRERQRTALPLGALERASREMLGRALPRRHGARVRRKGRPPGVRRRGRPRARAGREYATAGPGGARGHSAEAESRRRRGCRADVPRPSSAEAGPRRRRGCRANSPWPSTMALRVRGARASPSR